MLESLVVVLALVSGGLSVSVEYQMSRRPLRRFSARSRAGGLVGMALGVRGPLSNLAAAPNAVEADAATLSSAPVTATIDTTTATIANTHPGGIWAT